MGNVLVNVNIKNIFISLIWCFKILWKSLITFATSAWGKCSNCDIWKTASQTATLPLSMACARAFCICDFCNRVQHFSKYAFLAMPAKLINNSKQNTVFSISDCAKMGFCILLLSSGAKILSKKDSVILLNISFSVLLWCSSVNSNCNIAKLCCAVVSNFSELAIIFATMLGSRAIRLEIDSFLPASARICKKILRTSTI